MSPLTCESPKNPVTFLKASLNTHFPAPPCAILAMKTKLGGTVAHSGSMFLSWGGAGQAVKVLCCWSRLCLVWTAWPLHVLVFPLLPPFLPHFPSPHPGIQGHHGRGDTGPLAQDTGYRGHFYLWTSKTEKHTSLMDALELFIDSSGEKCSTFSILLTGFVLWGY